MAQRTSNRPSDYRAYLVRLWREDVQETWRVSAQAVHNGEVVRFATLQELFVFLEMATASSPPPHQPPTSQCPTGLTDE